MVPWSHDHKSSLVILAAIGGGAAGLLYWASRRKQHAPSGKEATGFDAYLRHHIDNPSLSGIKTKSHGPAKTSFEAYLRKNDSNDLLKPPSDGHHTYEKALPAAAMQGPPPTSIPVTVLFGTEFGFSREIAEVLCEKLAPKGYWPELIDMAELGRGFISQFIPQLLLVVCSTQGDGVPPTEARDFYEWLMSGAAHGAQTQTGTGLPTAAVQWERVQFSVCALGDTSYAHFCQCGRDIDARLEALGAHRFAPRVDVNKEDWKAIDGWMESALSTLPNLALKPAKELSTNTNPNSMVRVNGKSSSETVKKRKWTKSRPFYATIVDAESLCTNVNDAIDDKNTVRIEIDMTCSDDDSGSLLYEPGDALGVWPVNDPEAVEEVVSHLNVDGGYSVPLPRWHYEDSSRKSDNSHEIELREALSRCYDLRTPKRGLLDMLFQRSSDRGGCTTVMEYLQTRKVTGTSTIVAESDEDFEGLYLADRHVIDVLKDFERATLSPEELLSSLRQLAPRLYSISSSPLEKPGHVQITVAVVKYNVLGRDRIGVASTYLGDRVAVGSKVPVYIYPNPDFRLPSEDSKPLIMVGPGTGIAPFRAFIQHRLLRGKQSSSEMVLYFGCRRQDQDYLYGTTLEGWAADGYITLYTAFSRQQKRKVYVQDRLKESSELVWKLLQEGGHFYICGDGARMASDVESALKEVVARHGGMTRKEDVDAYVKDLEVSGRLQRDVWIS